MSNLGRRWLIGSNNDNYGTEKMYELPDRLRIPDNKGSNNTRLVGMAPVEGDVTVMVERRTSHDVPDMVSRIIVVREGTHYQVQLRQIRGSRLGL